MNVEDYILLNQLMNRAASVGYYNLASKLRDCRNEVYDNIQKQNAEIILMNAKREAQDELKSTQ